MGKLKASPIFLMAVLCGYVAFFMPDWKKDLNASTGTYLVMQNVPATQVVTTAKCPPAVRTTSTADVMMDLAANTALVKLPTGQYLSGSLKSVKPNLINLYFSYPDVTSVDTFAGVMESAAVSSCAAKNITISGVKPYTVGPVNGKVATVKLLKGGTVGSLSIKESGLADISGSTTSLKTSLTVKGKGSVTVK